MLVGGYRVGEIQSIEPVFRPSLRFDIGLRVDADVSFSHSLGNVDLELRNSGNAVVGFTVKQYRIVP